MVFLTALYSVIVDTSMTLIREAEAVNFTAQNYYLPFSALTLLVGQKEGHLACKTVACWFVGGDDLTGALHVL